MVAKLLSQGHYDPKAINDEFSEKVFNKFLEDLDPKKNIFLKSDVDSLAKLYSKSIDDELNGAPVASFIGVSKVFDQRIAESVQWKNALLEKPFDFTIDETAELNGKKLLYPANQQERKDRWRKMLKYYALERYVDLQEAKGSLKSDKNNTQLEKEAREKIDTMMTRMFDRYKVKFTEEDKFNLFVDNITTAMDPHTEFFPPADKRYFDEELSGSFFGIGAGLQYSEGVVKIISINAGSPAAKSGQLAPGDIITKVAQGADGEPLDMLGYDVQDAVKIIRGKEGTTVRLTIKKPDGTIKEVSLVRAKIDNDIDTYARSAIIKDSVKNTKLGIIYLPEFYTPFQDPNGRRSFTDVAREVQKLKDEKVDGIIMDLRRNGGGSLYDVVQMVGLFIKEGPIVQVKDRVSGPQVLKDEDNSVLYTGPLAVMVDEFSASASEIFAAAIQDYGRGVIIGSTSTYGKGTVQQNIGLDHTGFKRDGDGDLGAVKLTLRKFYRISGGSTQLKGVESDIVLPTQFESLKLREKDNEYALQYDEIPKSNFTPWSSKYDINTLKQLSNARLKKDSSFQTILKNRSWLANENERSYPLNIAQYKADKKAIKAKADQIIAAQKLKKQLNVSLLPLELAKYEKDENKQERLKLWIKSLSDDIYLKQAGEVMDDMIVEAKNFAMAK
ncbi:carboxy terminal-processing peptidase [Niabella ginsengisoli]|uniref:Carboxy terminal-processing peptidase n=1 Tax=Niabella ginsengisoli TaxID=522298 RepID=A0ABS9SJZ7_9BACT|nr:carboxy terminal-processing peptidase [Niabella ginsengisoli]MCH5598717.1 carboxy terminal-processing peptidase [Niabella ginsengisoli]